MSLHRSSIGCRRCAAGLVLAFGLAGAVAAQAPAAGPRLNEFNGEPGRPEIGGFWRLAAEPVFRVDGKPLPMRDARGHQLGFPYKPAWREVVTARYAADAKGAPYGDPNASCWPAGTFNEYTVSKDLNGLEIIQTPGRLELIFEYQPAVRWIYADGRPHASGDDLLYTAKGDSIGKWDGDLFEAETIAVRSEFTLGYMLPHSDQAKFIERFKRVDADTLQIDVTITDPVSMTKPVATTLSFKKADPDSMQEKLCLEETLDKVVGPDLVVRADPRVKKRYGFDLPNPH